MTILQITTETNRRVNGDGVAVWQCGRYGVIAMQRDESWLVAVFVDNRSYKDYRHFASDLEAALKAASEKIGELP